jgi:hypothetical protein
MVKSKSGQPQQKTSAQIGVLDPANDFSDIVNGLADSIGWIQLEPQSQQAGQELTRLAEFSDGRAMQSRSGGIAAHHCLDYVGGSRQKVVGVEVTETDEFEPQRA